MKQVVFILAIFLSYSTPTTAKILFTPTGEKTKTCKSIDQCARHLTPFGQVFWERGMTTPSSSQSMPDGADKTQILNAMGIPKPDHMFTIVQRRKLSFENRFIALLLFNTTESGSCENEKDDRCYFRIGLFNSTPKGLQLIAKTQADFYPKHAFPDDDGPEVGSDAMGTYGFAPNLFPFMNDVNTFSILSESIVGYSGGFATYVSAHLFEIKGDKIHPAASGPSYVLRNIAGNWNKDQTREHDLEEKFYNAFRTE